MNIYADICQHDTALLLERMTLYLKYDVNVANTVLEELISTVILFMRLFHQNCNVVIVLKLNVNEIQVTEKKIYIYERWLKDITFVVGN